MITDFISIYDNLFSHEECEEYMNFVDHYIKVGVVFKEDNLLHQKDNFTLNVNNDPKYDILSCDNLSLKFLPKIQKPVDNYLKNFSILSGENLLIYDTKIKKIPICGGFHEWHYENKGLQHSPRKLVVQLYLNTIDEGGETEFLYLNRRIKAKKGRMIIFPSDFTHTHRGNPPIGQDKYIVTTWVVSQS